jgi:DNA mismatch endonuclease (patch repair protein)
MNPTLKGNAERDKRSIRKLRRLGWRVLVVWECQTTAAKRATLDARLRRFLE